MKMLTAKGHKKKNAIRETDLSTRYTRKQKRRKIQKGKENCALGECNDFVRSDRATCGLSWEKKT